MKLTHLTISNFLGARDVSLALAPVTIFAGRNGAGKSSIVDAITLLLTADMGRVHLKKDAPMLISEGAKLASCSLETDGGTMSVSIAANGKIVDSQKGAAVDTRMPYVLNGQRFAKLPEAERRAFLFGLMGVKSDPAAVLTKLKERGLDAARVDAIATHLRSGFDAAADHAATQARDARAQWKGITGTAYGEVKAETWAADAPAYDADAHQAAAEALTEADAALAEAQQAFGALKTVADAYAADLAKLPGLEGQAAMVGRVTEKMTRDNAGLADAQRAFDAASSAATGAPRVGLVHDLALSLHTVLQAVGANDDEGLFERSPDVETARAALGTYAREHGPVEAIGNADPQAAGRAEAARKALDLMTRAVANNGRDLKACQDAAAEVSRLKALPKPDAEELRVASDDVQTRTAARAAAQAQTERWRTAQAAAAGAASTTARAAAAHAAAKSWGAIADAVGPEGIPAELLSQAIEPMNERLAESAMDTDWPAVRIEADMSITAGGRLYTLRSESEQFRCDAMLAEAIGRFSGIRLLVLDRIDMLDVPARGELIAWLEVLVNADEIDTALLFGTLKAAPQGLPDTMAAHWIDAGACRVQEAETAEA